MNKLFLLVVLISASFAAAAGVKTSEYFEDGSFQYHKWLGSTSFTRAVWEYQPSSIYGSNYRLNWYIGEDGDYTGDPPYTWRNTWFMKKESGGGVVEVGDAYGADQPNDCHLIYSAGQEIRFGPNYQWNVGDGIENPLHHTGSCGTNTGWNSSTFVAHYASLTIPASSTPSGSTCPQTTFNDVIKISNVQWFSVPPNSLDQYQTDFFMAKDFGVIRMDFRETVRVPTGTYDPRPVQDQYFLRRLCTSSACICPTQTPP